MSEDVVTRLVVGEAMKVHLGRPVGQRAGSPAGKAGALRWQDGAWVANRTKFSEALAPRSFAVPLQGIKRATAAAATIRRPVAVAAALIALVAVASAGYWSSKQQSPSVSLPIARAAETSSVTVVSAPYATEPMPVGAAPLPIAPHPFASPLAPSAVNASPQPTAPISTDHVPSAVPLAAPAQRVAPEHHKSAGPAKQKEPEPRPAAVLLDDPSPAARSPAAARPAASGSSVAVRAPESAKPTVPRGRGLVTITPDGKLAVFTNPKTGLPEQFKVGDSLPTGETVRTIDYKEGKVVTSAKEYSLD